MFEDKFDKSSLILPKALAPEKFSPIPSIPILPASNSASGMTSCSVQSETDFLLRVRTGSKSSFLGNIEFRVQKKYSTLLIKTENNIIPGMAGNGSRFISALQT
ncbi:unnamed protein product [Rhizophagus irregularis]|nr:unnamed protein product [Rhizophagus irregularis]CAB5363594.1 unnamed protein product [Rhizophagus irregularis]